MIPIGSAPHPLGKESGIRVSHRVARAQAPAMRRYYDKRLGLWLEPRFWITRSGRA